MILHVTFTDGANPWVSLPGDRHTIAKQWRRWEKNHPNTARPVAYNGDPRVVPAPRGEGGYYLITGLSYKHYKHLGHALAALDRLGGTK